MKYFEVTTATPYCGEELTGHNFIISIEEVNEAGQDLRKVAKWYNDKYRLYGYCCPPELLFDLED